VDNYNGVTDSYATDKRPFHSVILSHPSWRKCITMAIMLHTAAIRKSNFTAAMRDALHERRTTPDGKSS